MKQIRKDFVYITCLMFLLSCGTKHTGEQKPTLLSNLVSITDNEDKGVKEILEYYGGYCKYAVGSEDGKRYFELELSKSQKVEKHAQRAEMPASNIAFLFFRSLTNEVKNYDAIHTVLVFEDGEKMNFKYPLDTLRIVNAKFSVLQNAVNLIGKDDFAGLRGLLDETLSSAEKEELITNLQKYQPILGGVKELIPYGFRFYQASDGQRKLHISGIVLREKQNNEISIDLNTENGNDKIQKLNYKL